VSAAIADLTAEDVIRFISFEHHLDGGHLRESFLFAVPAG
jgi:hypothetical protein